MYQLQVTVIETMGAYVCSAALSETDQFGRTTLVTSTGHRYLDVDPAAVPDDFAAILNALARFADLVLESP